MSFKKKSLITYSGSIIVMFFSALTALVTARLLGPSGKGAYSLLSIFPYLIFLIGNLGIGHASTYYICRDEKEDSIVSNALIMALVIGIPMAIVLSLSAGMLNNLFIKEIPYSLVLLAIWTTPFYFMILYLNNIFLAKNVIRFNLVNILQASTPIAFLGLASVFIKVQLQEAVSMWALGMVVTSLLSIVMLKGVAVRRPSLRLDVKLLTKSIRYGSKMYTYYLTQFLNFRLDYFLVSFFLPLAQVGFYSVATAIAEIAARLPSSVGLVIFPTTASNEDKNSGELIARATRQTLFLVSISVLMLFLLGRLIISVFFGETFLPATASLFVLLPGMLSLCVFRILVNGLAGWGKPEHGAYAGIVAVTVTIALDIALIPRIGILGAALASTVAYTAGAVTTLYFFISSSEFKLSDVLFLKPTDLAVYRPVYEKVRRGIFTTFGGTSSKVP